DYGPEHDVDAGAAGFAYSSEDLHALRKILQPGRYDVVVGNPPYITVKDLTLKRLYRKRYKTCRGTYALAVPFMERFFGLAISSGSDRPTGWVGQITSNSFMKREFGAPLIENFLSLHDLQLVVDTSGAYIPGHGTPTVIIVGRPQSPVGTTVRAVLGIRGELGTPAEPAEAAVWRSIADNVDEAGHNDGWTSTVDLDRDLLAHHPWSLTGGGAVELRQRLEFAGTRPLKLAVTSIGFMAVTREDDAYVLGCGVLRRRDVDPEFRLPIVSGAEVRDWRVIDAPEALCTYRADGTAAIDEPAIRLLWPVKQLLLIRRALSGTQLEQGLEWWEYSQLNKTRFRANRLIAFAFVATHNHFQLCEARSLFIRSAPVIKLPGRASEDEHLEMLGVLNSSTACFWLKQNSHDKGNRGGERSTARYVWEHFYEFTGTTLQDFPLPKTLSLEWGRLIDGLAHELECQTPGAVCGDATPTRARLNAAREKHDRVWGRMIAVQEELDWEVYRLYGFVSEDMTYQGDDLPELALGERAFEIVLARAVKAGEEDMAWFDRHGSTSITDVPGHWPAGYRDLLQRRLDLIAEDPSIRLLEKPEYKRRWSLTAWEKREQVALRGWLLDRLEDRGYWFDSQGRPLPRSIAQLADAAARDRDLVEVLALWEGRPDVPVTESLQRLLADEAVPYLAAYRYKESGLRTRGAWERTWELQRREDAGEQVGKIPVPPRYTSADFARKSYWDARGKLDVPKERFIAYPDAGRDTDSTPLLGWAGWDHAEQALALGRIVTEREAEGWADERLVPLVAGLAELQPWVAQWHAELHTVYGISLAAYCDEELTRRCAQVGRTREQLAAWRPAPPRRGRRTGARAR
ncbi:MAG: BREX-2 system adenine-specific DNA-methyltransferase PglX, partial [Pseudonocardiaceae bacterium]